MVNRPKKILVFSPFYPPYIGGLGSHAEEFNLFLSKENFKITVFTNRLPPDSQKHENIHNVEIIRFPAIEIIPNYPLPKFWNVKFWQLYLGLFKNDYQIVISRIRFFPTTLLALIFAKINRIKWVHIEHTSNFTILSSKFKTLIAKLYDYSLGALVLKKSDINISISKAVQKFVGKFDKRFSPIIYRGLELEKLDLIKKNCAIREKYENKILVMTAARLYKWKGIEYSVEAIKKLPLVIKSQLIFLIIGDGEDFDHIKKMSSGESSILMMNSLTREEVICIMKAADIYIHSSMPGGGLSTSLLEAMHSNCAVIATPNEGADEIIKDGINGIIIKKPYTQNIENSLIYLAENRETIIKLGKEARDTIEKEFSWPASISQYNEIFDRI
jgi:glycosyltransferase involved in cell wall biosynthesis